jgi:hypothetical protein
LFAFLFAFFFSLFFHPRQTHCTYNVSRETFCRHIFVLTFGEWRLGNGEGGVASL